MIRVGILGVTGYAGAELARLIHSHPEAELVAVTGRSAAGQKLSQVFPHLHPLDLTVAEKVGEAVDLVFSSLPHGTSADECLQFLRREIPVVDLSADFRLKDTEVYARFYGRDHPAPELLAGAVYGLPEVTKQPAPKARLVANPGCYAAGALLALAPAVANGLIDGPLFVDGKSGISGAGRTPGQRYHYPEASDTVTPYGMAGEGHRHRPEIDQELQRFDSGMSPVSFVPHLVPMTRGILTTAYGKAAEGVNQSSLAEAYAGFYAGQPFVRVVGEPPSTNQVSGTNNCLIMPRFDERSGTVVVVSAIDNLGKGAAGQAVQNMNRVLGMPETTGLDQIALFP